MVGDESALPAIAASLEAVPAGRPVVVRLVCDGPEHELPLSSPGDLDLRWLHRTGAADDVDALADAVSDLEFPAGRVHAFVHGEAEEIRGVRRHLLTERGLTRRRHVLLAVLAADDDRRGVAQRQARLRGRHGGRRRLTGRGRRTGSSQASPTPPLSARRDAGPMSDDETQPVSGSRWEQPAADAGRTPAAARPPPRPGVRPRARAAPQPRAAAARRRRGRRSP